MVVFTQNIQRHVECPETEAGGGSVREVLENVSPPPQQHAYDIVYRHALALDEAGDRLAFGSTTGGRAYTRSRRIFHLCLRCQTSR